MQDFNDLNQTKKTEETVDYQDREEINQSAPTMQNEENIKTSNTEEKQENQQNVNYVNVPVFVPVIVETPENKEKKAIKKTAMLTGLACLVTTGITYLWSTVYFAIMSLFGISNQEAYLIAQDPFVMQFMQIIISTLMFTLPFILVYKLAGYKISETVALLKPEKSTVLPLVLMGVGFCSFANIAVSIAGSIFSGFGIDYSVDHGDDPEGILGFIISFISTAIIPALVEEFACRGLILGSIRKFGDTFAIVASAFIFSLIHGNFEQMPFAFLIGIILGFITVKTGSIWIACLIHGINNALSVFITHLLSVVNEDIMSSIYNVYLMAALLLGIIGAVMLSRIKADAFSIKKSDTIADEFTKHKWFLTQPLIIILIIICTIESVTHFF